MTSSNMEIGSGYDVTMVDTEPDYLDGFAFDDNSSMLLSNGTNDTTTDMYIPELSPWWTVLKATIMFTIIIAAILGNLLVIASVLTFRNLQIISNSFIVSLAFADLLVAILVMPFSASQGISGHWIFNQLVCDIFNGNDVMFSNASLVHLCCISMDRYIAITDPFHYRQRMTKKRVAIMLTAAWGVSALLSHIPVHTGIYTKEEFRYLAPIDGRPGEVLCLFIVNEIYGIISSCVSFWIPTFIMVFTYAMIFREARRQERNMHRHMPVGRSSVSETRAFNPNGRHTSLSNGGSPNGNGYHPEPRRLSNDQKLKKEHKAAKTLGIIMGAFLLCWLPFFLWYVITTLCGDERCPTPDLIVTILFWVGYLNSALNPMIYAYFNKEFRKAFVTLLKCQTISRFCTNHCCRYCVRRGWIRKSSDPESSYFADLPPRNTRSARPSNVSSASALPRISSAQNGSRLLRGNYDTVPEKEDV